MQTVAKMFSKESQDVQDSAKLPADLMITKMFRVMNDSFERERALTEKNKQLVSMYNAMVDNDQYGILMTDLEGIVIEFNRTAESLFGQKAHHIVGKHVRNVPEIGGYIARVLSDEERFEKIYMNVGGEVKHASLFDAFPMYDENAKMVGAFAQLHDISEAYRVHDQFNYLSNHDEHTELPNRRFLKNRLADLMSVKKFDQGTGKLVVIYFSLDRFKTVNETLGYTEGDRMLTKIVQRLENSLAPNEFMARVGGDEFVIIAPCDGKREVVHIGDRFQSLFNEPFTIKGYDFHITASGGIATYPEDGSNPEELLFKSNAAMSYAKRNGKNKFIYYTKKLDVDAKEKILLEASFRKALDSGELVLHYQPKIEMKTGLMSGVEALVRWQHPERGLLPPDEFIPLAEETGLISQLDEWVLRKACEQNKRWQGMGLSPVSMAVNLSSTQFASNKLVGLVETVLRETGLKPEYLELEITETMAMDVEHAIPTLKQLSVLGVKISLDDFGTGYSSLSYLTKFAIDRLKIDRSFIWNIDKSGSDSNIVVTIIRMAHSLGLKVIAEGVEDDEQLQFLDEHGCDEVQGFFYSKPLPAEEIKVKFLLK